MQGDILPTVLFNFVGDSDVLAPPLKCMDIVITSYWSMILLKKQKSTWIRKILGLFWKDSDYILLEPFPGSSLENCPLRLAEAVSL